MIKLKDLLIEAVGGMDNPRRMEMLKRIARVKRVSWKGKDYDAAVKGNNILLTSPNGTTRTFSSLGGTFWNWKMMHPPVFGIVKLIAPPADLRDPHLSDRPGDHRGWNK